MPPLIGQEMTLFRRSTDASNVCREFVCFPSEACLPPVMSRQLWPAVPRPLQH
jgi:hypothetical protein